MTRIEIVAVAIRLIALWIVFTGVSLVAVSAVNSGTTPGGTTGFATIILAVFLAICGLAWKFSVEIATRLLPAPLSEARLTSWTLPSVERVAFRVLALYLIALGLSGVAYSMVYGAAIGGDNPLLRGIQAQGEAEFARMAVFLVFGVALFLGKAGMKDLLRRFRGDPQA